MSLAVLTQPPLQQVRPGPQLPSGPHPEAPPVPLLHCQCPPLQEQEPGLPMALQPTPSWQHGAPSGPQAVQPLPPLPPVAPLPLLPPFAPLPPEPPLVPAPLPPLAVAPLPPEPPELVPLNVEPPHAPTPETATTENQNRTGKRRESMMGSFVGDDCVDGRSGGGSLARGATDRAGALRFGRVAARVRRARAALLHAAAELAVGTEAVAAAERARGRHLLVSAGRRGAFAAVAVRLRAAAPDAAPPVAATSPEPAPPPPPVTWPPQAPGPDHRDHGQSGQGAGMTKQHRT